MTTAAPPDGAVDFLSTAVLFKKLPTDTLEALAAATVERSYPAGGMIIRRGDPGDGLFVVTAGLVQVCGSEEEECGGPTFAVLGPGEAFGELSLLDGKPRSATVVAAWNTRCLFLPRDAFLAHLDQHPRTALALLQVLVGRLREMDRRMEQVW